MAILEDAAAAKPSGHAHDQAEIRSLVAALATLTAAAAAKAPAASTTGASAAARRTSGSLTPASTSWANLDTGLDLVIAATAGQWIEVGLSGNWSSEATSGCIGANTVDGGNSITGTAEASTTEGVQAWRGSNAAVSPIGGSVLYQVVSGDISGGNVTIRFRIRCTSAVTKTLFATSDKPLQVWARNVG